MRRGRQTRPLVTLLSDFGSRDPYVGAMRGALLSVCLRATLVDLTHEIPPFDVLEGAYALAGAWTEFPPGTVHLAVVDPGVGGARRPLAARAGRHYFVGPDNGLLGLALERAGDARVREIRNPRFRRARVHPTFHGRDLFAPAAGWLARGISLHRFGPLVRDWKRAPLPGLRRQRDGSLEASVLHIDRFGNVVSNISASSLPPGWLHNGVPACRARLAGRTIAASASHYAAAPRGRPFLLINSLGYVEAALGEASLASRWRVRRGDRMALLPLRSHRAV